MVEKHFISPTAPLPKLAAKWFADKYADRLTADFPSFDGIVAIVPTREAARNFRNALLQECRARKIEAFAQLNVSTLEDALAKFDAEREPTAAQARAIWLDILSGKDLRSLAGLFPNEPPVRSDFLNVADEIMFLHKTLAENLTNIAEAAEIMSDSPDSDRWGDLAALESEFLAASAGKGLASRVFSLKTSVKRFAQSDFREAAIMGVPDASAIMKAFVEEAEAERKKISVAVFSDSGNFFDDLGAPAEKFSEQNLCVCAENIRVFSDIEAEAEAAANLAVRIGKDARKILAISCEQKESADAFAEALNAVGINAANLAADTFAKSAVADLLRALSRLSEDDSFANIRAFLSNPYVLRHAEADFSKGAGEVFKDADFLFSEILPSGARQARDTLNFRAQKSAAFEKIKYLGDLFESALSAAQKISRSENPADEIALFIFPLIGGGLCEREQTARDVAAEALAEISAAQKLSRVPFEAAEVFSMALGNLSAARFKTELPEDRIALQDWMEIFWSSKPHLLLCDMNDGIVPLADSNGMFLNDSTRKKLGLRTQAARRARDAYMLETLCASRKNGGAVTVCVPNRNLNGDPLAPSRILFQTDDLAARVKFLFAETRERGAAAHYVPEWEISVPAKAFDEDFSATKINSYLNSPWEFYLRHVLKAEIFDAGQNEMNALQFGDLFHSVMFSFANSGVKDSFDEREIADFLGREFDKISVARYGKNPRAQLRMQFENMRRRLISCAPVQAAHRKTGWRIKSAETPFEFELAGEKIVGRYDRVDVNDSNGFTLLLDYKTVDKATAGIAKDSHVREFSSEGLKHFEWKNLQLPLYKMAALSQAPSARVACAYFVAPKDVSSATIDFWDADAETLESAQKTAIEAIANIRAGRFELDVKPEYENFKGLFGIDFETLRNVVRFRK